MLCSFYHYSFSLFFFQIIFISNTIYLQYYIIIINKKLYTKIYPYFFYTNIIRYIYLMMQYLKQFTNNYFSLSSTILLSFSLFYDDKSKYLKHIKLNLKLVTQLQPRNSTKSHHNNVTIKRYSQWSITFFIMRIFDDDGNKKTM
jgi:hypothetical protein